MCTLTYLPTENGFIFTSNRDEQKLRAAALPPQSYSIHGEEIIFPKDGAAGGTWFASGETLQICLLNGAFEKHIPQPPYRLSRGIVLLDAFQYTDLGSFYHDYSFDGIEPFTLVGVDTTFERRLLELRWDGTHAFLRELIANQAQIWSSATLYPQPVRQKRKEWFREFLSNTPAPNQDDMLNFHQFSGEGEKSIDLVMERNNVLQTLSITSLSFMDGVRKVSYLDLVEQEKHELIAPVHV